MATNETNVGTVLALIEDCSRDLTLLPVLADALEDCGETKLADNTRCPRGRTVADSAPDILSAWAFFIRHAGSPLAYAWQLALAERHAEQQGWGCEWREDEELADYQDEDGKWQETRALGCVLLAPEESDEYSTVAIASIGGIIDPSPEYLRVVEAELALEAIGNGH